VTLAFYLFENLLDIKKQNDRIFFIPNENKIQFQVSWVLYAFDQQRRMKEG